MCEVCFFLMQTNPNLVSFFYQWDLAFPESFRELFNLHPEEQTLVGPDIIFAPICWYATDGGSKGLLWNRNCEATLLDSLWVFLEKGA